VGLKCKAHRTFYLGLLLPSSLCFAACSTTGEAELILGLGDSSLWASIRRTTLAFPSLATSKQIIYWSSLPRWRRSGFQRFVLPVSVSRRGSRWRESSALTCYMLLFPSFVTASCFESLLYFTAQPCFASFFSTFLVESQVIMIPSSDANNLRAFRTDDGLGFFESPRETAVNTAVNTATHLEHHLYTWN
jgi:hypothetical protein